MNERSRSAQGRSTYPSVTAAVAVLAALAATLAPASLTGSNVVDVIQRAGFAGLVSFVGAHGRRRAWLVAGALIAIPAGGVSMVLALAGLAIAVASALLEHRSRRYGAAAIGCYANAMLWYPPHELPWGVAVAVLATVILVASGFPMMRSAKRRKLKVAFALATAFVVTACALLAIATLLAGAAVRSGSDAASDALDAARNGNRDEAAQRLDDAGAAFDRAAAHLDGVLAAPASLVPGAAQQLHAVRTTVRQGQRIAAAGDDLVDAADYDGLKYDGQLDLERVDQLVMPTKRADVVLQSASQALDDVSDGVLLPPLRDGIRDLNEKIDGARRDTKLANALATTVPELFGRPTPRRYLVIFLTPAELRGAGGFIGSYAELTAADGKVTLGRSGRIDDLIHAAAPGTRTISGPADYIDRYGRFRPQDFVQDATFSPNFPSSAQVIAELYPQSGGDPVDGVIGVDPTGLAALLKLSGPVQVEGLDEPLDADNAVDLLTRRQYLELGTRAERGEVLADATRATFDRLVSASLPSPRSLATTLSPAARGGHLRLWSPVAAEQRLFEQLGADGTLSIRQGTDGFSVVQRNVGNNKIDAYLHRTIDYEAEVDATSGRLTGTLRIALTNDVPAGVELPAAVVGNTRAAPDGTNVTVVTVHTRNRVTRATLDGKAIELAPDTERGMYAWDSPDLQIGPGQTVVLELALAGELDLRDGYDLRILPQPTANPDEFTATLTVLDGTVADTNERTAVVVPEGPLTAVTDRHVQLRR